MPEHHYVYRVDFLEIAHVYFGSRTSKCLPKLDTKYMGSPKTYKHYWRENTPVKTILVTGFRTRETAIVYEANLIRNQWALNKELSLNDHIPGEQFHRLGKYPSEEERKRLSEAHKGHSHSLETRQKMSSTRMGHDYHPGKKYVGITPGGDHIVIDKALKFCKTYPEFGLCSSGISDCISGRLKTHQGWRFFLYEDYEAMGGIIPPLSPNVVKPNPKSYVGLSVLTGDRITFTNALQFIRDNPNYGFSSSGITNCAKGVKQTHKGWKFSYADESDIA
jgi:hypothetical protein